MAILEEGARQAAFIVSEATGYRSRSVGVVDASAGALESGTILGRLDGTGAYVRLGSGGDGSETVAGILMLDMPMGTSEATIVARDAEVSMVELIYGAGADQAARDAANAGLAALGIIVR